MTDTPPPLRFRLGAFGAVLPLLVFVAGVTTLAAAGAPDERGFWPVLLLALAVSRSLARDGGSWSEAVLAGVAQPIVAVMVLAWLLSGVLGTLLAAGGLVDGVTWVAARLGAGTILTTAVSFLACALLSTATGTSFGTLLVAGPILYGAGVATGVAPAVLLGAILAGATWGDSISPVSDTSIASAGSQGVDVAGTVRTRLRYVIPAGLLALAASVTLAALVPGTSASIAGADVGAMPRGLLLALVPLLVVTLLARGRPLLDGLLIGVASTIALALLTGLVPPDALLRVEPGAFGATGVLVEGMQRGIGVSVFTILLMALLGPLQASGTLDRFLSTTTTTGSLHVSRAEGTMVAVVTGAVFLTTHSVVAILAVGPVIRRIGEAAGVTAYRRANLLDLTVCVWPFLLPWFLPTILAASVTAGGEGLPRVSPGAAGLHNTYAWALLLTVGVAVGTGYGRSRDQSS